MYVIVYKPATVFSSFYQWIWTEWMSIDEAVHPDNERQFQAEVRELSRSTRQSQQTYPCFRTSHIYRLF